MDVRFQMRTLRRSAGFRRSLVVIPSL